MQILAQQDVDDEDFELCKQVEEDGYRGSNNYKQLIRAQADTMYKRQSEY